MEETMDIPTHNFSANGDLMHTETASSNKKRKFPAEQLGLPSPKHISRQSSYLESGSITNAHRKDLNSSLVEVESGRRLSDDISQSESAKDSNSLSGGNATAATMSISGQVRNDIWCSKASSSDQPSTSSINWASTCSTKSLYSLESRSVAKSSSSASSDETGSSCKIGEERDQGHSNFGLHSTPYYDNDHEIEFISYADYTCSELGLDNMEQCTEDEDQDGMYTNGMIPDNYVLSVNQENEQGAKKLTIDKEFEEYFSSLML